MTRLSLSPMAIIHCDFSIENCFVYILSIYFLKKKTKNDICSFSDRCSNPELTENNHNFKMKSFDETAPRCDHCAKYLW